MVFVKASVLLSGIFLCCLITDISARRRRRLRKQKTTPNPTLLDDEDFIIDTGSTAPAAASAIESSDRSRPLSDLSDDNIVGSGDDQPVSSAPLADTVKLQVTLTITSLTFTDKYRDRASKEYMSLSREITSNVKSLYDWIPGSQVKVYLIGLSRGSVRVQLEIVGPSQYSQSQYCQVLEQTIRNGAIGQFSVANDSYSCRLLHRE